MRPEDIQVIGEEMAIKWDNGTETFVRLETLRRGCPCAGCAGEKDIMGNVYKGPDKPLLPESFRFVRYATVGGYGIQPQWGDDHGSGIFSFDYLQHLAGNQAD